MQDLDIQQSQSQADNSEELEMTLGENSNVTEEEASDESQLQSFLKLKEHGQSSRTRALRLREDDIVVAIDGVSYHDTVDNMAVSYTHLRAHET